MFLENFQSENRLTKPDKEHQDHLKKGLKEKKDFQGFTPEYLGELTMEELVEFQGFVEDADAAHRPRDTPMKRRRL